MTADHSPSCWMHEAYRCVGFRVFMDLNHINPVYRGYAPRAPLTHRPAASSTLVLTLSAMLRNAREASRHIELSNDFEKKSVRPNMGGIGSRQRPDSMRRTTSTRRQLNINTLRQSGVLDRNCAAKWAWRAGDGSEQTIDVEHDNGTLLLRYRIKLQEPGWTTRSYAIQLAQTPCNLGGNRHWFLCPSTGCGGRVACLFLSSNGYFTCRRCQRLTYDSQYEKPEHRLMSKADKIRIKLGWGAGIANPNGGRPKGMHFRTYMRLAIMHDRIALAAFEAMLAPTRPQAPVSTAQPPP